MLLKKKKVIRGGGGRGTSRSHSMMPCATPQNSAFYEKEGSRRTWRRGLVGRKALVTLSHSGGEREGGKRDGRDEIGKETGDRSKQVSRSTNGRNWKREETTLKKGSSGRLSKRASSSAARLCSRTNRPQAVVLQLSPQHNRLVRHLAEEEERFWRDGKVRNAFGENRVERREGGLFPNKATS